MKLTFGYVEDSYDSVEVTPEMCEAARSWLQHVGEVWFTDHFIADMYRDMLRAKDGALLAKDR